MSIKKLSRVVIAALVLTLVLAVSSFAVYTINIDGTVAGLEDGVSYTAAKYDFANNTYGEFTELTDETVLTTGVWGIKAGDAEPTVFFAQSAESGKFNFWNEETEAVNGSYFKAANLTDSFVPGFWSAKKGTAFSNATFYEGFPSVCIHLEKNKFLKKAEGATTWENATHIEGENNLLAEAEYFYGFTNEQVVPASAVIGYTSGTVAMKVGSVSFGEGYSEKTLGSKVVFYTKTIGSDVVAEYVAETTTAGKFIVTVPSNIPATAYIVGIGFRPYAEAPDDVFVNAGANNEARGYYHHYMNKSLDNGLTITPITFDAPEGLTGGILNVEGLEEGKFYQFAHVTLNAAGNGYAIGEWQTLTEETETAGLVVVRYTNEAETLFSEPSDIIYVSGKANERQQLGHARGGDENPDYIACKSGTSEWVVGYFAGNSAGQVGEGGALKNYNSLDQGVGTCGDIQTLWLYQHTEEEAEAKLTAQAGNTYPAWTGTPNKDTFQKIIDDFYAPKAELTDEQFEAERVAQAQKVAGQFEARNTRYTYDNTEIVPVEDVSSFSFFVRKRQGCLIFTASSKVVFKVMDLNGNVTDYAWTSPAKSHDNGGDSGYEKYTVDLTELLADAEGYIVGFAIYPFGEIDTSTMVTADGQYLAATGVSARFIQNQAEQGWYPDEYGVEVPTYPAPTGIIGAYGKLGGLKADGKYQYAYLTLNGTGTALVADNWNDYTEDTTLAGLVVVREVTRDGGYTEGSAPVYVYGSKDTRLDLGNRAENGTYLFTALGDTAAVPQFNVGKWTGRQIATSIANFGGVNAFGSFGSGWINAEFSKKVKTAEANLAAAVTDEEKAAAQAALDAAKQKLVDRATKNYFTYAYDSTEIVPINEVEQFAFNTWKRMGSATYNGNVYSTVDAYVAHADGTITVHRYTTEAVALNTKRTVDFTNVSAWTPALPADGWLVALSVDQWAGMTDFTKFTVDNNGYNTMPNFIVNPADYKISDPKLVLPPVAADLSGLYEEDGVVKGFDKKLAYGVCKVTPNGVSDNVTLLPAGATSYTLETGLWAFRVIGNGITEVNSLPSSIFYKEGNSRANIIHTESVTVEKTHNGSYPQGETVDRIAMNSGLYGTVEFNEGIWTATHNFSDNLYTYWIQGSPLNLGSTGNHIKTNALNKALTSLAADPENAELQADAAAKAEVVIAETTATGFAYQFTPDEIIPMSDFVSHTFKAWCRQTGVALTSGKFQTKYVLKVMLEDGSVVDRIVYKDVKYGYNTGTIMTVTLDDFVERDGYIIGMVIYPYGSADGVEFGVGSAVCDGDVDVMFYADGYKAKAPANAPEFEIVAAADGVDVVIKNPTVGATYAWSLDNNTWTNGVEAAAVMRVPAKTGDMIYVKMLAYDIFYESYVAEGTVPAFKAVPALTLGEGNVLSDETGAYEIAKYTFGETLTYETLTEATLTTGVWAVRAKADATEGASAPQIFYIRGNAVGSINMTMETSSGFIAGTWTQAKSVSTWAANAAAWEKAGTIEFHLEPVADRDARRQYTIKYQMTEDEIIPVSELVNINVGTTAFYHGYIKEGTDGTTNGSRVTATYGQTMARVYVAGASVDYYDVITDTRYTQGFSFNIGDALSGLDGYVTAIELYPLWSIYGEDGKTELGSNVVYTAWNYTANNTYYGSYTFKLVFRNQFIENELPEGESLPTGSYWNAKYADGTNRYAIRIEKTKAATPTLSISTKNTITVTDYDAAKTYVYSVDGGETWNALEAKELTATKANTQYLVKTLADGSYHESEVAAITSNPLVVAGISLVLDGQIGMKIYFDIDTDVVNLEKFAFYTTKVNDDFKAVGGSEYRENGATIRVDQAAKWSTKLLFDEASGLYYVTIFLPAKDADNTYFENELHYYIKATEEGAADTQVKYGNLGVTLRVSDYIAAAKALVEAGDANFVAAADLIYATENYVAYADAYFGNKTVEAYKTDATIDVEAATRTNATLEGVQFYGTSLLLEDNVTIRHYFKVNDIDAFVAAGYTCDIDFGTKDGFIYYDITDIAAQDLGEQFALTIKNAGGTVAYEVNYAATNYMASMANDSNANLASLANAMYDYYLAAEDYAK